MHNLRLRTDLGENAAHQPEQNQQDQWNLASAASLPQNDKIRDAQDQQKKINTARDMLRR